MVEQIRVQELTTEEQKQDCGCGCGGSLCGAARNDCGCGCGGESGTTQQELVLVDSAQVAEMRQQAASNSCGCDGSCGCWSR